jgi:hypothetical protein
LKKFLKLIVVIIAFSLTAWLGMHIYMNSYISFVPIVFLPDRGGIQEAPKLNTPEHQKNIKLVLGDQHYAKWQVQDGKVMIQRKMMFGDFNRNYLWNLTTKADDPDFMIKFVNYNEYKKRFMKKYEDLENEWKEQKEWEKEQEGMDK